MLELMDGSTGENHSAEFHRETAKQKGVAGLPFMPGVRGVT
jgi:hypothetical protein